MELRGPKDICPVLWVGDSKAKQPKNPKDFIHSVLGQMLVKASR